MTIEVFPTTSIPQDALSPASEYLLAKWKTLKATGGLTLQRLTEEASYEIAENSIYLIEAGGDFAFMYVGQNVQDRLGINLTGALLSSRTEDVAAELATVYARVLEADAPALVRYITMQDDRSTLWQRMVLPLRIGNIAMLVCFS